jgi:hypothetical protein
VRVLLLAIGIWLVALGTSQGALLNPELCAKRYATTFEADDGWRVLGIYLGPGIQLRAHWVKDVLTHCRCVVGRDDCDCCEYDMVKLCDDVALHANSRSRMNGCPELGN